MARRPTLSTADGGQNYMGSEIRDSLSLLDVVCANQFEGQLIDPKVVDQTEENFYRGAPPEWLNFYISEQAETNGGGTPFIKRDGYDTLVQQIHKKRKGPGTSSIKLFYQQGSGGTTLAMQVLWDLRKTFRSAVLTGSTSDITDVAKEVVHLFTAGIQNRHNTVLLLLNNELILENLQDSIIEEIAEQELDIDMPVVILLNCVRASEPVILKKEHSSMAKQQVKWYNKRNVILKRNLSDRERQKFNKKKEELSKKYGDKCKHFHGFNIMQSNFSQAYTQEACSVFKKIKSANKPKKTQLAAFLSLLNAYVPGSYLLESQCLDFFKHDDDIHGDSPLEERMEPFSHLIITFQQDIRSEKKVCMAHPMIAQCCTELMANAGIKRSDTARDLLTCLCKDEVPPFLVGFVKDMLTKREKMRAQKSHRGRTGRPRKSEEGKERFSTLILHITEMEDKEESASVLKVASTTFALNSYFPQALSRFYYSELEDYNKAEKWAKEAKKRDPKKSFIADTLGQVHKNHLKSHLKNTERSEKPREILQLATKAIEAFKDEEQLAESEHEKDSKEDGRTKVFRDYNASGHFGYLQVCNLVYDILVDQNTTWERVLTKQVSLGSVLESLGDKKLDRFNDLISSLRDEVEKKFEFLDTYLTYSGPVIKKKNVPNISQASECYRKYVGDSAPKNKEKSDETIQKLKQKLAATSAGVLSCLDRRCTVSDVKDIATWWKDICGSKDSTGHALANYILANIMLINKNETPPNSDYQTAFQQNMPLGLRDAPELHMLALLVCWPTDEEDKVPDLNQLIMHVQNSYEHEYKTLFRSRYLLPLFFFGKGQGLNKFVHRRVLENFWIKDELQYSNTNWRTENIFKDPTVQDHLLKVEGVVRNYRLYATLGGTEIEVDVNRRDSLWKSGQVSFYLGFTIGGPVAFCINKRTATQGPSGEEVKRGACGRVTDSSGWTKLEPEVKRKEEVQTFSLQSDAGRYECSVSALRWVCKEKVSIKYQFCSWEDHWDRPSCTHYMPAGPLLDITVKAGRLEEVQLPHWIDHNSKMSDMFVVLHVESCGDVVEQVSKVTSSHVQILQPTFSPRGVMIRMKLGFPVKVFYDVLIYKTKKEFLTLHVYLVPPDRDIQQAVEKKETSYGSILIPKPSPDESLQMLDHFFLKIDTTTAEIVPDKLKLRYQRRNYFEVFIRNADSDFCLKLESKQKKNSSQNTVWTCSIRKGDYQNQSTDHEQGQHFVDQHRKVLINKVSETGAILDELLDGELISKETYSAVRATATTEDQMRKILGVLNTAKAKDGLYEILTGLMGTKHLISQLEASG